METIDIDKLEAGMICNQTICDVRGVILVGAGVALTQSCINRLKRFNIKKVEIQAEEPPVPPPPPRPEFPVQQTLLTIQRLTNGIRQQNMLRLQSSAETFESIIYAVLEKPYVQQFLDQDAQDEKLYNHSLRVTIIALYIGMICRYDMLNLEYLAMAGIMHDCGMGGVLKEDDRQHPLNGFIKMRNNAHIPMVVALTCLQHHERYDGKGFPFGLKKDQIIEFAKIIAIADQYDHSIIGGCTPQEALFKLLEGRRKLFDPTIINLLNNIIDWPHALLRNHQPQPLKITNDQEP